MSNKPVIVYGASGYTGRLVAEALLSSQKGGAFSSQTIQQVFRQLYTQIGFDGASSHSGRRTMLTKLAERGVHAHHPS